MRQSTHTDILLINGHIITVDAERRIISDGAVAVSKDRIIAVGKSNELLQVFKPRTLIDCKGGLVHPGLIDAHVHPQQHLSRSTLSIVTEAAEARHWAAYENALSRQDRHTAVKLACLEMLHNGTTCFVAMAGDPDITGEVSSSFGIRSRFAGTVWDEPGMEGIASSQTEDQLRDLEAVLMKYPRGENQLVQAAAGTIGMGRSSDRLLRGVRELADQYNVPMFMHQSFAREDYEECTERYGSSPVRHLHELGVLDSPIMLIHMNCINDQEADILKANSNVSITHCPAASLRFGAGGFRHGRFLELDESGVCLSLGSDAGVCSDTLDVTHQMYLTATVHRDAFGHPLGFTPEKAIEMATVNAARALGEDDHLGSIAKGYKADIVIHSPDLPEAVPMLDPVANFVFSSRSRTIRTVLVDGQIIINDGDYVRCGEHDLIENATRAAENVYIRSAYRISSRWPHS